MDATTLALVGIVIGAAALAVALVALYPTIAQWRIDRDPERHYRLEGPERGWYDMGDAGRPQLNLTIWNDRSVPVELGVQAMDVRKGYGGGGRHLYSQRIAVGHAPGAFQSSSQVEVPARGHRRLSIIGITPERGYRGDLGVAVTDGDRRIFLIYHHADDDPQPFEPKFDVG